MKRTSLTLSLLLILFAGGVWAEEKEERGFIINLNEGMNLAIERLKSCGAKVPKTSLYDGLQEHIKSLLAEESKTR